MDALFASEQIKSGPPTAEQIQAEARQESRNYRLLWLACVLSFLGGALYAGFGSPLGVMLLMLTAFTGLTVSTINPLQGYEDIDANSDCDKMYRACEQSPEGRAYRQAVIAQGRRFVNAELRMMDEWNKEQQLAGACKRLYDIPA
jgi:hypothetical protein